MKELGKDDPSEPVFFSPAFFNDRQTKTEVKELNSLLPMISEPVTPHATVYHCKKLIKKITAHLKSTQQPLIVSDQAVHVQCKQIQLMFPS